MRCFPAPSRGCEVSLREMFLVSRVGKTEHVDQEGKVVICTFTFHPDLLGE